MQILWIKGAVIMRLVACRDSWNYMFTTRKELLLLCVNGQPFSFCGRDAQPGVTNRRERERKGAQHLIAILAILVIDPIIAHQMD